MFKYLVFLVVLPVFIACKSDKKYTRVLPIIGHHDIALIDGDGYKKGDTIFHTIEDFTYLTQDSTILNASDIDGKIWVAKFFFTHCPTICPPMTDNMNALNDSISDLADEVVFLSFSIDPERDTPARMRLYMNRHHITAKNWYFLTGDEAETHRLGTTSFYVNAFADNNAQGGFAHSANLVLVDKERHVRGLYDGLSQEGIEQLETDIRKLLKHEYSSENR